MRTRKTLIVLAVAAAALAGCGQTDEYDCSVADRNSDGDPV